MTRRPRGRALIEIDDQVRPVAVNGIEVDFVLEPLLYLPDGRPVRRLIGFRIERDKDAE